MLRMTATPSTTVAGNIRAEMARRGISQAQLADAVGMRQTSISKRLRGEITIDLDELDAIADYLEVAITDLFTSEVRA